TAKPSGNSTPELSEKGRPRRTTLVGRDQTRPNSRPKSRTYRSREPFSSPVLGGGQEGVSTLRTGLRSERAPATFPNSIPCGEEHGRRVDRDRLGLGGGGRRGQG